MPSDASMNSLRTQHKIKNDAEELTAYLKDMGSWENAVRKKDRAISKKSGASKGSSSLRTVPPVRASGGTVPLGATATLLATPVAAAPPATGKVAAKKNGTTAAAHTYDRGYKKWEDFDADAALDDVDVPGAVAASAGGNDSGEDDAGEDVPVRVARTPAQLALGVPGAAPSAERAAAVPRPKPALLSASEREAAERERGNAHFKAGEFSKAAKCYTACLGISNRSAAAFSNRAMCMLKLKEWKKAETDCSLALQVDPAHVKSYQRRASARNAMGMHRAALGDLASGVANDTDGTPPSSIHPGTLSPEWYGAQE